MSAAIILLNQAYLMGFRIDPELMDDDYQFIVFEFQMNYTVDSIRIAYQKYLEDQKKEPDNDILRKLGYSDDDILNKKQI